MRVLTPTENKRFNEMIGFVGLSLAVLLALSLLSYSPHDASFNVSAAASELRPGAQLDWARGRAYRRSVLPARRLCGVSVSDWDVLGGHALVPQPADGGADRKADRLGDCCSLSLSAEMTLVHVPDVRGALPAGGLLGTLLAEGLRAALNPVGANLVSIATLLTALFLTTSFSFSAAASWMKKPMASEGIIGQWMARVKDWREERESVRLRKHVEDIKIAGRPPGHAAARFDQRNRGGRGRRISRSRRIPRKANADPTVIQFHDPAPPPSPKKSASEPKISHGKTNFKLPSPSLLRTAERGEKMDEAELKECARAIEQKCSEFEVGGHITQINPGPGRHHFRIQARSGNQIQPHHGPRRRPLPRAARRIYLDRAHSRKIHRRNRSAQRAARNHRAARRDRVARILAFVVEAHACRSEKT